MERPKIGYCQRIDLAPNVLLVDTAKLHELIEWSVWAEQELSKLHQPTVISSSSKEDGNKEDGIPSSIFDFVTDL